ncbi:hypothetical protein WJX77_009606 [Trebouxia sp. C0004]
MTASPHWAWHNLQNGLAVGEAAKLEAGFFQGSAPIELYRDVFYCTAGIILLFGLGFYGMTRLVQIILLIGLFVLNFGDMSHTSEDSALYWVGMIMTIALVLVQLYTFVIYRAIWRSTSGKLQMTRLKSHNLDASPDVLKNMELPRSRLASSVAQFELHGAQAGRLIQMTASWSHALLCPSTTAADASVLIILLI